MTSVMVIAKVRLVTLLQSRFWFLVCSNSWLKTLLTQFTSPTSSSLSTQTEIWIFPLITYFRYHVTEYCAVIGMHSIVQGDKLLYGHVPDPFLWCRIEYGRARLFLNKVCLSILWLEHALSVSFTDSRYLESCYNRKLQTGQRKCLQTLCST